MACLKSSYHIYPLADNEGSKELNSLQIVDGQDDWEVNNEPLGWVPNRGDGDDELAVGGQPVLEGGQKSCFIEIQTLRKIIKRGGHRWCFTDKCYTNIRKSVRAF